MTLAMTWWIPVAGGLVVLLGVNTLCCFAIGPAISAARWRKCGEYLIHIGFVLILGAYLWGSQAGFRSGKQSFIGWSKQSIAATGCLSES